MSPSAGPSPPQHGRREGARKPPTHFDVQVQDAVLVQVADPLQDLPHVGPDLQESRGRVGTLSMGQPHAGPVQRRVWAAAPFLA